MLEALLTLRPEIAALAQRPGVLGQVFWVNAFTGADTNSGRDPSAPLQTIQAAINLCTNDHNDYILCTGVWEEAAMPIEVNKTTVHILGIGGSLMCPAATLHATGNTAIFVLTGTGNNCEIAGFSLGGGGAHGSIENLAGTVMGLNVHHCVFGHSFAGADTPMHGINIAAGATALTIANCIFLGSGNNAGGFITTDGINISISANTLGGLICNNLFVGIPGRGIYINNLGSGLMIVDNVFALDANTQGAAITLSGNVLGCLVARNSANFGDTAMAAAPFLDSAGAGANTWVANQDGGGGLANTAWALPA